MVPGGTSFSTPAVVTALPPLAQFALGARNTLRQLQPRSALLRTLPRFLLRPPQRLLPRIEFINRAVAIPADADGVQRAVRLLPADDGAGPAPVMRERHAPALAHLVQEERAARSPRIVHCARE